MKPCPTTTAVVLILLVLYRRQDKPVAGETLRQHEGDKRIPQKGRCFGIVCTFSHIFSHCTAIPTLIGHER